MSQKRQVNLKASELVLDSTFHKLNPDQLAQKYGITKADVHECLSMVGLKKTRKPAEKDYTLNFEMDLQKQTSQNVVTAQTPPQPPPAPQVAMRADDFTEGTSQSQSELPVSPPEIINAAF